MFNGIILMIAAIFIVFDALQKLNAPIDVPGNTVIVVAAVGLLVNTGTALLFFRDRERDLNIKGAFLHMAADAGVLLGGLAIKYTGVAWIDPVLGLVIVAVIVYSVWGLLGDSVRLALDGVPQGLDQDEIQRFLENVGGVEDVHDLHVWALSTTEIALTVHLVIPDGHDDRLLYEIRKRLHDEFKIAHTTIQVEKRWGDQAYRPSREEST